MADKFGNVYQDPTGSAQISGSTPYNIYDADKAFQKESVSLCIYVSR